jgi:hypothetical protein
MLPSENGGRVENVNESHEIISIRRSITDCATSATIRSWRQDRGYTHDRVNERYGLSF